MENDQDTRATTMETGQHRKDDQSRRADRPLPEELVSLLDQMENDLDQATTAVEEESIHNTGSSRRFFSLGESGPSERPLKNPSGGAEHDEEQAAPLPAKENEKNDSTSKEEKGQQTRSPRSTANSTIPLLLAARRVWDKLERLQRGQRRKTHEQTLPHDTYSYMMLLPTNRGCGRFLSNPTLYYVIIVIFIQVLTLSLVLSDRLASSTLDYNTLNIPADVDIQVRLAQCVALLIVVFTQDDTIVALRQLDDGYHAQLTDTFTAISFTKWLLSNICRLLVGWLELFVAFLLIVQEDSVIDIFLNFLAVAFVSEVDNLAHALALQGFAGTRVQTMAERVHYTTYIPTARTKCGQVHARRFLMALIVACIMAAWAWVVNRQNKDVLLTPRLFVQFSDDFLPALGAFSGMYALSSSRRDNRVTYVEERSNTAMLAYCEEIQAWTFSFGEPQDISPCRNFRARSVETTTYDILNVVNLPWYDFDENLGELPMAQSYFHSFDCRNDNVCGLHGRCRENQCECERGWFGLRCEFRFPCASIETDERGPPFLGTRIWSTRFEMLRDNSNGGDVVTVYHRPVYTKRSNVDQVLDLIFFTGRRWVVTHSGLLKDFRPQLDGDPSNTTGILETQLSLYMKEEFHAYWSNYTTAFVSEPVDVAKPKDAATPISLLWFNTEQSSLTTEEDEKTVAMPDGSQSLDPNLICSVCDDVENPCFFASRCENTGVCNCITGASGTLCQIPPTSNGRCNPFFNNPEFQYDGGDCCQATCRNGDDFFCGTSISKSGLLSFVGFDNCVDPSQTCDACWKPLVSPSLQSIPTSHQFHSFFRNSQYMDFSGDGSTLAVHNGLSSSGFQVYSVEEAQWVPRGDILGIFENQAWAGSAVALSYNGFICAIADDDTVQVYVWDSGWLQLGQTLVQGEPDTNYDLGNSLALSDNGDALAVGFVTPGAVIVYDLVDDPEADLNSNFAQSIWSQRGPPVLSRDSDNWWTAISLSGDGNTIAIVRNRQ